MAVVSRGAGGLRHLPRYKLLASTSLVSLAKVLRLRHEVVAAAGTQMLILLLVSLL